MSGLIWIQTVLDTKVPDGIPERMFLKVDFNNKKTTADGQKIIKIM